MPVLELADWVQAKFSGKQQGRRRRSRREESFSLLWIPVGTLAVIVLMRYLLGPLLVEVELFFELLIFRLFLVLPILVCLFFAIKNTQLPQAGCLLLVLLVLVFEAAHHLSILPNLPRSAHARTDLKIFTQNVGMKPPSSWEGWFERSGMDVVLLQEVYVGNQLEWEAMADRLGFYYMWDMVRTDAGMGGMILSKYPLTRREPLAAPSAAEGNRYFVWGKIEFHGSNVELISVHLESFHMVSAQEQGLLERDLFSSADYRHQQAQLLESVVSEIIKQTGDRVIVAGDFNASPTFRSVRPLRNLLADSWLEAGTGLGGTFPASFPLIRIDAILHHGFKADFVAVTPIETSDHRGVTAVLNLN